MQITPFLSPSPSTSLTLSPMSSSQPRTANLDTQTQDATSNTPNNPQTLSFISPDNQSVYAQSDITDRTSLSRSSTFLAKIPLLSRKSRSPTSESLTSGSSSTTYSRRSSSLSQPDNKKRGNLLNAILFRKSKPDNTDIARNSEKDSANYHKSRDSSQLREDDQPTSPQERADSNNTGYEPRKSKGVARDPVKTVPSGKPPAVTFTDLAYRYGSSSGPHSGSKRL
ncbi:hypothetical protein FRC15_005540 [Serendipita sp. 397]|nr:hypothetical protein FRC15_005540 [Serendipita sp. 397]